ncbi:MAG TPA: tetratricopeptide repeat protein [Terriglobia bacterium]|nr:tetratricopeptide repeat protein [Terriglobia bacterium]
MVKPIYAVIVAGMTAFLAGSLPHYALAFGSNSSSSTSTPSPTATKSSSNTYDTALNKINAGDYLGAIPLLQQSLAQDPNNSDALNELGFSLRKTGRLSESLEAYQKALALNPSHIDANEYLGELYLQMKRPDLAQKQLDVLARLCPSGCEQRSDLQQQLASFKS